MKQKMWVVVALLVFGCSNDRPTQGYAPVNPYDGKTPVVSDGVVHNKLVINLSGSNYTQPRTYPLDFDYPSVELAITSAHTAIEGSMQIQLYDRNDNVIFHTSMDIAGDLVQHQVVDLQTVPTKAVFDFPGYTGELQIVLTSVNR